MLIAGDHVELDGFSCDVLFDDVPLLPVIDILDAFGPALRQPLL
jgi:hypothetical protein